jgi:conjugative transposon TraJ protein
VFGLSIFDGLQNTLTVWIARYINVFLWPPVANIFGSIIAKIQENMLRIDIEQINLYGDTFFSSSDTAYIIFLIIGIIGYFTVPSVANYIVHAGGTNILLHKATNVFTSTVRSATAMTAAGITSIAGGFTSSGTAHAANTPNGKDTPRDFMHDKLSGNK